MTRHEQIEKQAFLLAARSSSPEGIIVCPRCDGWGHEADDLPDETRTCKLCKGRGSVKRRVTIVVDDSPVSNANEDSNS